MTRLKLMLACVVLLVASGVASAQAPKWSYFEAGYLDFDPDAGVSDSGVYGVVSLGLFLNLHLVAEYDDIGDYTFWNAGVGWHGLLGDPGDLYAQAVWTDVEVDSPTGNASDDGYAVSGGVRWKFPKWFEVKGQVNWVDLDAGGDDTTFEAEGIFSILGDRLGFGANFETGDDDTWRLFARFSWGR